jgi:hypothetical protein
MLENINKVESSSFGVDEPGRSIVLQSFQRLFSTRVTKLFIPLDPQGQPARHENMNWQLESAAIRFNLGGDINDLLRNKQFAIASDGSAVAQSVDTQKRSEHHYEGEPRITGYSYYDLVMQDPVRGDVRIPLGWKEMMEVEREGLTPLEPFALNALLITLQHVKLAGDKYHI